MKERRGEDIADTWTRELGVLRSISGFAGHMAATWRFYAGLADSFQWEEATTSRPASRRCWCASRSASSARSSRGTARSASWPTRARPALIAGCTVVIKASPEAPAVGLYPRRDLRADRLPPKAWSTSSPPTARCPSGWSSTPGSTRSASPARPRPAGASPRSAASASRACTLELGGKSPAVILDDYDLDLAAEQIAATRHAHRPGLLVAHPADRHPQAP